MAPRVPYRTKRANERRAERAKEQRGESPHDRANRRKAEALKMIAAGNPIADVVESIGMSMSNWSKWRENDKVFAAKVDSVRQMRKDGDRDWAGDHAGFAKRFFGITYAYHHLMFINALEETPLGNILLVLWPPGHGKTSTFENYASERYALNPEMRITIASENLTISRKILGKIKRRMEPDGPAPDYVATFGPFKPEVGRGAEIMRQPWAADHFNIAKRNVSDERDYCVDETTEILTQRGWKRHDDLRVGELVAALDHKTGLAQWEPLQAVNRFEAKPRAMLSMEGQSHSSLTTPSHRWPIERSRPDHKEWVRDWTTSGALNGGSRIFRAAPFSNLPSEPKWSDAAVELAAWYWTEGNVNKGRRAIYQSPGVNPTYYARIKACITELFREPGKVRGGTACWNEYRFPGRDMAAFNLWREAAEFLDHIAPNKIVEPWFIAQMTYAQLRLFIETSIDGDGVRGAGGIAIPRNNPAHLEGLSMACALAGIPTSSYPLGSGMTGFTIGKIPHAAPVAAARKRVRAGTRRYATREWVEYDGMVWCPTTESGTWLARRKGTTYFTGNSCMALGWESSIVSTRTDLLHLDDVQSTKTYTPTTTNKIEEWFRQDALSRPGEHGITTICGTRVGDDDFYERIMRDSDLDGMLRIVKMPAITRNDAGEEVPLWPERYDLEQLDRMRRKVGVDVWDRNWMQQPGLSDTNRTFNDAAIAKVLRTDLSYGQDIPPNAMFFIGVDPALGGRNCTIGCEVRADGKLIVRHLNEVTGLRANEQIMAELNLAILKCNQNGSRVTVVVIETMNFQKGLKNDERLGEMQRHYGFSVREHLTGWNKYADDVGVPSMVTSFLKGEIEVPYKESSDRARSDELVRQLKAWKPGLRGKNLRQDMVMSLWFVWILWRQRWKTPEAQQSQNTDRFRTAGLPYEKTRTGLIVPVGAHR